MQTADSAHPDVRRRVDGGCRRAWPGPAGSAMLRLQHEGYPYRIIAISFQDVVVGPGLFQKVENRLDKHTGFP